MGEEKKATVSKSFVLFPQTAVLLSPAQGFSHLLLLKGAGGFLPGPNLNGMYMCNVCMRAEWCGSPQQPPLLPHLNPALKASLPGLTHANSFSQQPCADSHGRRQDPTWVPGV